MTAALGAEPSPEKKARFEEIHKLIDEVPKYGNDIPDVDYFARDVAYTYTKPLQKYKTREADIIRPDFIRYPQMFPLADRPVLHRMAVMHIHQLQMVFLRQQARM